MTEEEIKQLESLGINVDKHDINFDWNDQKFLHVAPSKSGKSIYWAQDENPYFFKFENRHNHFVHIGVKCRTFDDADNALSKLLTATQKRIFPFTSVIIDPVDRFIQRIDEDVIEWAERTYKTNFNCIGDIPNGSGWYRRTVLTNGFLARLEELPCAKVLLFHSHVEEQDDRKGSKIKKRTIDVGGKAGSKFLGWADHILHGEIIAIGNNITRRIHTKGTQTFEAGKSNPKIPDVMVQKNETSEGPDFPIIKENFMVLKNCFEYEDKGK